MVRPAAPAAIAANSPATSAWANSVANAVLAILNDIYGVTNLAIPWGSLTGVPGTFTPAAHAHAWGDLTGVPGTFMPITAAGVVVANAFGMGATAGVQPQASRYDHSHGTPAFPSAAALGFPYVLDTPNTYDGGKQIFVGTAAPVGAVEGDVWIKG